MTPRIRKLVGSIAILAFLVVYTIAAVRLADLLPDHPAVDMLYFVIAGTAWGLPLIPLLSWMNRD